MSTLTNIVTYPLAAQKHVSVYAWVVTATFPSHGKIAYWKEHEISANSLLTKYRFYTANSMWLNVLGQVPDLVRLSFLFSKMGSWEDKK